jgi:Domain of unknown function (DUF4386)
MSNRTGWVAPFLGLVFVAAYIAVAILLGEGQDATKKSAAELVTYYRDHDTEQTIGALLIGVAAITLLFWAGQLRRVLRDAEGPTGTLSAVAFAGAIVFAGGAIVGGTIHFALADYSDDTDVVDPLVFQALNAFDWDSFLFFPVGLGTMLLASGICAIRHGALPKWLGWVAIVLGIAFLTPAFPVGLFGTAAWVLVVSIVWLVQGRTPEAATPS